MSPFLVAVGQHTFPTALKIVLSLIEDQTGFDFSRTAIERKERYEDALKASEDVSLVFASIVIGSVGRQSLVEPVKNLGQLPLLKQPQEWTPLSANVLLFFSTMPSAFYESLKNFLKALHDEESENLYR